MPKVDAMRLAIRKERYQDRLDRLGLLLGHTSASQTVEYLLDLYLDREIKAADDFRRSRQES